MREGTRMLSVNHCTFFIHFSYKEREWEHLKRECHKIFNFTFYQFPWFYLIIHCHFNFCLQSFWRFLPLDVPYRALIKNNIKFSAYMRKFRMEQLQSHKWLTNSSYMGKYLCISSYIRKPFLIYDFATAPLWISLYIRKILFYFLSVRCQTGFWCRRSRIPGEKLVTDDVWHWQQLLNGTHFLNVLFFMIIFFSLLCSIEKTEYKKFKTKCQNCLSDTDFKNSPKIRDNAESDSWKINSRN